MSPSTTAPPPRLLTVAQAADHLGTTTSKLYELVASRALASVRIGRAIRIPQYALDQLDRSGDQRRSSPSPHGSAADTVPMLERSHSAQYPGEPRQPNSREAARSVTDLHRCATRRRVDAGRPREARS
jgi:excisionase family DNA binding protein